VLDALFRMLQPHELAAAQGFSPDYEFTGTKEAVVRQIGNAVPPDLAKALVMAVLSQRSDILAMHDEVPTSDLAEAVA
jgi:site-specific DNA-cytosine methylase